MKKIAILFVIVSALLVFLPTLANAETDIETKIEQYVGNNDKIVDCKCVEYNGCCILAIKTEKFVNKTEYEDFKDNLQREIAEKFNMNVVAITRSPKVFCQIAKICKMDESERQQLAKEFLEDFPQHRPTPQHSTAK